MKVDQLGDGFLRLGLIPIRPVHLVEVAHSQLELGVVGAPVRRVERQELAVLVDRQHVRFGAAFPEVRIGESQLGISPVRALRDSCRSVAGSTRAR